MRRPYLYFTLACLWQTINLVIVCLQGFGTRLGFHLSDSVLIASLIASTATACTVVALLISRQRR